jgi:hypothetical protein
MSGSDAQRHPVPIVVTEEDAEQSQGEAGSVSVDISNDRSRGQQSAQDALEFSKSLPGHSAFMRGERSRQGSGIAQSRLYYRDLLLANSFVIFMPLIIGRYLQNPFYIY